MIVDCIQHNVKIENNATFQLIIAAFKIAPAPPKSP